MAEGAKRYGDHNWHGLPISNCTNHALKHIYQWIGGDRSEDHLGHAAANLLMAAELEKEMEDTLEMELPDSLLAPAWRNLCRTNSTQLLVLRMTTLIPNYRSSSKQAMLEKATAKSWLEGGDGVITFNEACESIGVDPTQSRTQSLRGPSCVRDCLVTPTGATNTATAHVLMFNAAQQKLVEDNIDVAEKAVKHLVRSLRISHCREEH